MNHCRDTIRFILQTNRQQRDFILPVGLVGFYFILFTLRYDILSCTVSIVRTMGNSPAESGDHIDRLVNNS